MMKDSVRFVTNIASKMSIICLSVVQYIMREAYLPQFVNGNRDYDVFYSLFKGDITETFNLAKFKYYAFEIRTEKIKQMEAL